MSSSGGSTTTRSSEVLRNLPLATACTIGLCCSVYVSQLILDINTQLFTMCPRLVLHLHEYYRIITSCFFHGSLMHVGMNMMSTAGLGAMIERRFGTLSYIITCMWSVLLTGVIYLIIAVFFHYVLRRDHLMYQHSLGFSGVLFHLLVLESNLTPQASRSVFGFVHVPSYIYPFTMLFVMQFIMPTNLSFTGHLCGILVGYLQLYGLLDCLLIKEDYIHRMEQWEILQPLTTKDNFISTPNTPQQEPSLRRDPTSLGRSMRQGCTWVGRFGCNVLETIQVAIFGRGRRANANLQLGRIRSPWADASSPASPTSRGTSNDELLSLDEPEDEEDWIGLPLIERERVQQSQII